MITASFIVTKGAFTIRPQESCGGRNDHCGAEQQLAANARMGVSSQLLLRHTAAVVVAAAAMALAASCGHRKTLAASL